jgi:thiamine biosynthesis lipoprotein
MKSAAGTGNALTFIIAGIVLLYALGMVISGDKNSSPSKKENAPHTKQAELNVTTFKGTTMGTTYTIKVADVPSTEADVLEGKIDNRLDEINGAMSIFDPSSQISLFNLNETTDWFPVSEELFNLIERSKELSIDTNKTFDITVGSLVNLWGFGSNGRRRTSPPERRKIREHLRRTGLYLLKTRITPKGDATEEMQTRPTNAFGKEIDTEKDNYYHIRRVEPELYIDLGAIAKGYAVDEISDLLLDMDYRTHMVEIGGEIKVAGARIWRIAVENPIPHNEGEPILKEESTDEQFCDEGDVKEGTCTVEFSDAVTRSKHTSPMVKEPEYTEEQLAVKKEKRKILNLRSLAVATSGDYRNFFKYKGVTYSHTINPKTGYPVEHNLRSVSVIHDRCADADAIATALMVMGKDDGMMWVNENNIKAIFYTQEGHAIKAYPSSALNNAHILEN